MSGTEQKTWPLLTNAHNGTYCRPIVAAAPATATDQLGEAMSGTYLQNVHAQPETLRSAASAYSTREFGAALSEAAALLRGRAVTSTGMGASFFALQASRAALDGVLALHWIDETSYLAEDLDSLTRPMDALLAVSQSGETIEGRNLLPKLVDRTRILITRNADSALAAQADVVLAQHCPADLSVSVQTYITQVAVLKLLAARIGDRPTAEVIAGLGQCADAIAAILTGMVSEIETAAKALVGVRQIYALGRGESIASALGTALLLKEGAKRDCEGQSSAQFRHGAVEVISSDAGVIVFAASQPAKRQLDLNLIGELVSYGARVVVVSDAAFPDCGNTVQLRLPAVPPMLRSIVEIVPSQLITHALAEENGVTAGEFRNTVPVIVSA